MNGYFPSLLFSKNPRRGFPPGNWRGRVITDYCSAAIFLASILARVSGVMFQMKRNAIQEPTRAMAGISRQPALIPAMAEAGWVAAPAV